MFALKRTSLGSVLDCVAPCLEESLLSLAKLRAKQSAGKERSKAEHKKGKEQSRAQKRKGAQERSMLSCW